MDQNSRRIAEVQSALGERYQILKKISSGGFAEIYLAEHTQLGRKVAIKVLLPHLAEKDDLVKRFQRESRWAAQLNHPNIIDIYDVGEGKEDPDDGIYYFVMKYVEGETLTRKMFRDKRVAPAEAINIIRQLADALAYADENSVVHRDIKPSNVMLDEYGKPVLMDFGVARVQYENSFTLKGTLMGTPHYLAPEQPLGKPVDGRSDIYSLGIMSYEMLSGQPPFHDEDQVKLIFKHIHDNPPPLQSIVPELSPELCRIVHKMIEKSPQQRYQSADEIVSDLTSISDQYPLLTPSNVRRAARMITASPDGKSEDDGTPVMRKDKSESLKYDTVRMALDQENLEIAIASLTQVMTLDRSSKEVKNLLRETESQVIDRVDDLCERRDFDGARELLDQARKTFPDTTESRIVVVERSRKLYEEFKQADDLMKQEKLDEAARKYQDLLETPAIYDFHFFHGLRKEAQDTLQMMQEQLGVVSAVADAPVEKNRASRLPLPAIFMGILAVTVVVIFMMMSRHQTPEINPERGLTLRKSPPLDLAIKATTGKINVTTDPVGASIYLAGQSKGAAPLAIDNLAFGKYALKVSAMGYKDLQQEFELTPEDPRVQIMVTLEAVESVRGTLEIRSTPPGAIILIGGKEVGVTPKTFADSLAGKYTLTLQKDGYNDYTLPFHVYQGRTTTLDAELKKTFLQSPSQPQGPLDLGVGMLVPENVVRPKAISQRPVQYPDIAKAEKLGGTVLLKILVSEAGRVVDVKLLQSADPALDDAADKAVRDWTYEPATRGGVPVSAWIPVTVTFVQK